MTHQLESYGLILLFFFVAIEGCGIPLPGETALIAAAVLAGSGHFDIVKVIAVAAAGAIVGDNTGYWIARLGGRALLGRIPIVRDALPRFLPRGERFFERHGPKTVVVARFIAGLRITAAWLAGISHMPWRRFVAYNAVGGTTWATAIGLAAYEFGQKAVNAVTHYGLWAVGAIAALVAVLFVGYRLLDKRMEKGDEDKPDNSERESTAGD
jgi:membrane protein DedA with SNARE-associated domain